MKSLCQSCWRSNMECTLYDGWNPLCTKCLKQEAEKNRPPLPKCVCPHCPTHNTTAHSTAEMKDPVTIKGETVEG